MKATKYLLKLADYSVGSIGLERTDEGFSAWCEADDASLYEAADLTAERALKRLYRAVKKNTELYDPDERFGVVLDEWRVPATDMLRLRPRRSQ